MHQPPCIDYPNVTSGIRELSAKAYIKWINRTPHCHHGYPMQDIKCSQIHNSIQSDSSETSKVKLNSSQEDRGGETPYDPTILKKSSWYIKIVPHQEHEREREREIKHIATGTFPHPWGWTTPSSSWRPPGWWRWPPVMVSPSGRVLERAPDWLFMATQACGGWTPDIGFCNMKI